MFSYTTDKNGLLYDPFYFSCQHSSTSNIIAHSPVRLYVNTHSLLTIVLHSAILYMLGLLFLQYQDFITSQIFCLSAWFVIISTLAIWYISIFF